MEAQVWTLIGLLGATMLGLFGALFQVGGRLDRLNDKIDSGFDRLNDTLDSGFDRLITKLDDHLRRHAS